MERAGERALERGAERAMERAGKPLKPRGLNMFSVQSTYTVAELRTCRKGSALLHFCTAAETLPDLLHSNPVTGSKSSTH
jgi:hypothetical protein